MDRIHKHTQLGLITLLALFLFNFPLLFLFGKGQEILGIPLLYGYLLTCWIIIIILTAWVVNRRTRKLP